MNGGVAFNGVALSANPRVHPNCQRVQRGGKATFNGQVYRCDDCGEGVTFTLYTDFTNHATMWHGIGPRPTEADVIAAREILNRHPELPLPFTPDVRLADDGTVIEQMVYGQPYATWAGYGKPDPPLTCDDCGVEH